VTYYTKKITGFFPFYRRVEVHVWEKALKLVNLGQGDAARSDRERYLKVAPPGVLPVEILR